jgi:hypothetical protein
MSAACFILLQIFNLVVSRRINDEYNFFEGLHKSTLFLVILAIIVFCQVRGLATHLHNAALLGLV